MFRFGLFILRLQADGRTRMTVRPRGRVLLALRPQLSVTNDTSAVLSSWRSELSPLVLRSVFKRAVHPSLRRTPSSAWPLANENHRDRPLTPHRSTVDSRCGRIVHRGRSA